ncbi:MAG TPA: transposase [Chitinophagaceae bacterium]|nr:transposase [Chitinophagaceae bacterium]
MSFIRKIKKGDAIYLAKVESYREDGKVKQRVLEYVGKQENGIPVQKVDINKIEVTNVQQYADVSILYQLAIELKLNYLLGKHYQPIIALIIAHLICKGSIFRVSKWIENSTIKEAIGLNELTTEMLYNALDHLDECKFEVIEQSIFEYWLKIDPSDNKSFELDVTDTYYNGRHDESKIRKGKDGKVSKLIQIGLGVSFENGFPIFHKSYNGNISNIKILEDLMRVMAERGINTIVMDRGFYSESNVMDLNKLKMKMIVGVKQSIGIKKNILDNIERDKIYAARNQVTLKGTYVYVQEVKFLFGKMIVIYNPKYEALKRDRLLADEATDNEVKYVGYSLIFHNTVLKPDVVVKKYFDKDVVERSFRKMKGDVQLHPIRLWLPKRVNAHIKICYLSMCLLSLIKFKCKKISVSPGEIIQELQTVYKVNLKHTKTKQEFTKVVTLSNNQKNILKALKCSV